MDKRKVIKIFIITIVFFIMMAILEISLKNVGILIQEYSEKKELEKEQQKIYNSDSSVEIRQVEKIVDDVYIALENKKYEVVYNLLNSTYKYCFFENDFEKFKSFVQEELFLGEKHNIVEVTKKSGNYIVLVGITKGEIYKTQTCAVEIIDENTYCIMFDGILKLIKTNNISAENNNIKYKLKYYYETSDLGIFVLDVINSSDENVNIELNNIYFESSDSQKYNATAFGDFSISANQNSQIMISYKKTYYSLKYLNFVETRNGKTADINMELDELFDVNIE